MCSFRDQDGSVLKGAKTWIYLGTAIRFWGAGSFVFLLWGPGKSSIPPWPGASDKQKTQEPKISILSKKCELSQNKHEKAQLPNSTSAKKKKRKEKSRTWKAVLGSHWGLMGKVWPAALTALRDTQSNCEALVDVNFKVTPGCSRAGPSVIGT